MDVIIEMMPKTRKTCLQSSCVNYAEKHRFRLYNSRTVVSSQIILYQRRCYFSNFFFCSTPDHSNVAKRLLDYFLSVLGVSISLILKVKSKIIDFNNLEFK